MKHEAFDIRLPLLPGVTVVQASAGTGKTWSIATLVARLVAEEGIAIDRILVMTFTKAATAELRDRIRGRLGAALAAVSAVTAPEEDALLHLWQADRPLRQERLAAALRDYDTAAVYTIHSFCQRVLQLHAFESQVDFGAELLDQTGPIIEELVDDYLSQQMHDVDAARCAWWRDACKLTRTELKAVADFVTVRADVPLPPLPAGDEDQGWENYRREVEAFREAWTAQRGSLLADLDADTNKGAKDKTRRLSGAAYKTSATQGHARSLDAWLQGGAIPFPGLAEQGWGRYFTARYAAERKLKDAPEPFVHPLLDAWEHLTRQMPGEEAINRPRLAFAHHVRSELPRRLRQRSLLSFSDLLGIVHERVCDQEGGKALRENLRGRYSAVLIDEFQDTDAKQWGIFEAVFAPASGATPRHHLYLIGDPKQAIYGFRGADVFVYSQACQRPDARRLTMTTNQRSDGRYVAAMNALFAGPPDPFGSNDIAYEDVSAAARNQADRLVFPDLRAPLQIRWFDAQDLGLHGAVKPGKLLSKGLVWGRLPALAAGEVRDLLATRPSRLRPTSAEERAAGAAAQVQEPLRARDITVLVRKNRQAAPIRRALRALRIPAIVCQTGNVWQSEAALTVLRWLEAVARPGEEGPTRLLAVTPVIGLHAAELLAAQEDPTQVARWAELRADVRDWAEELGGAGLLPAIRKSLGDPKRGVYERLASRDDGERWLTDLRHVIELLHTAATQEHLNAAGLLRLVREARGSAEVESDATQQRLESDADAVQVTTLHRSKGLQFPVVVLPYLWDGSIKQDASRFSWHQGAEARIELNLCKGAERDARSAAEKMEQRQEVMRLLYVGLTRAEHHCVALWGPVASCDDSALGAVLFGRGGQGDARASVARDVLEDVPGMRLHLEQAVANMQGQAATAGQAPLIAVRGGSSAHADGKGLAEATPPALQAATYTAAPFDGEWRRLSYTSLARGQHTTADEQTKHDDDDAAEQPDRTREVGQAPAAPDADVPMFAFPRGKGPGTCVHKILECLDFATLREQSPMDARAEPRDLAQLVADVAPSQGVRDAEHHAVLVSSLSLALATPLGEHAGLQGVSLGDIGAADRLSEWNFDLVFAGAAAAGGAPFVDGRRLAQALALDDDPAVFPSGYIEAVRNMDFGRLAGYLTGSIDLAFRTRVGGQVRWFIADYKTNALGTRRGGRLVASAPGDYAQAALRAEMAQHDYFLQYHLYLTALHRYLSLRMGPAYSYERDVGGAVYLFLRGMVGPETVREGNARRGVFFHKPRFEVIEALSRLFGAADGGRP